MTNTTCIPKQLDTSRRIIRMQFKRTFLSTGDVTRATLRVGCSGYYRLRVNGILAGRGVCRTYPEFAEYDSYEVTKLLIAGENAIEVEVLHQNTESNHHLKTQPYFYASGTVVSQNGSISLDTPGDWLATVDNSDDPDSPNFSFSIGPTQIRDRRVRVCDWGPAISANCPTPGVARTIPQLTERKLSPQSTVIRSLKNAFRIYSKTFVSDDYTGYGVIETHIHSPRRQTVDCLCWWGDFFIEGKEIQVHDLAEDRATIAMPLSAGWNHFKTRCKFVHGKWDFALATPSEAKLVINMDRCLDEDGVITYRLDGQPATAEKIHLGPENDSPLTALAWHEPGEPISTTDRECLIQVDMGKLTLARVQIECEAPEGTVVDIGYAEEKSGDRLRYRKNVLVNAAERWIIGDETSTLETFEPRGFRFLEMLIRGNQSPVALKNISVNENVYPYDFTGEFECSDEHFNTLWEFGKRTLELCSEDVITDCPWRERTLFGGDMLASMGTAMALTHDLRLFRRSIEVIMQSYLTSFHWLQGYCPAPRKLALYEYPMLTVIAMDWYCRMSGDQELAKKWQVTLSNMLEQFLSLRTDSGLYRPPIPAFISHYPPKGEASLAFNACGIAFLQSLERLLPGAETRTAVMNLREAIENELYDKDKAVYLDVAAVGSPISAIGNAWNIYFNECATKNRSATLNVFTAGLADYDSSTARIGMSPYDMFYFLGAMRKMQEAETAETAIRTVYQQMLERPTGTIWEQRHSQKSLCHAWSTGPCHYFATTVLGVDLTVPDKIVIAPDTFSLRWARGTVPHPLGDVHVEWRTVDDRLEITYKAPAGAKVEVTPTGRLAALQLVRLGSTPNNKDFNR